MLGGPLKGVETPVQVLSGRSDPVVPLENAEYLHERLPNSRLGITDGGHFIREENAADYAESIIRWWKAN